MTRDDVPTLDILHSRFALYAENVAQQGLLLPGDLTDEEKVALSVLLNEAGHFLRSVERIVSRTSTHDGAGWIFL